MKKTAKQTKPRHKKTKLLLLLFILLLVIGTIFYPHRQQNNNQQGESKKMLDLVLFPGSVEQLYTEDEDRITISYRTDKNVNYQEVIAFYIDNLTNSGWKLVSSSDIEVVLQKNNEKLRIWVLYANDQTQSAVDYIIDYYPSFSNSTIFNI